MDEVSLFEPTVIGAVLRHWRLVVAVVVAFVVPAGLFALTRPEKHTATASLSVSDPRGPGVLGGQNPEAPDRYVSDQLVVFRSASLADRAARRGLEQKPRLDKPASWFLSHTAASAIAQDNNLVSVAFSAPSDAEAMAGLRAVVGAYADVVRTAVASQAEAILAQLNASV